MGVSVAYMMHARNNHSLFKIGLNYTIRESRVGFLITGLFLKES